MKSALAQKPRQKPGKPRSARRWHPWLAAASLLPAACILISPTAPWWIGQICVHWTAHACFLLLPALAVFGRRPVAGASLLFLIALGCVPWCIADLEERAPIPPPGRAGISVASANVYTHNPRRAEAIAAAERVDADLLCLVEVEESDESAGRKDPRWPHQVWAGMGGMALLSARPLLAHRVWPQEFSAWIEATIDIDGAEVRVLAVHTTSPTKPRRERDRGAELNRIAAWVRKETGPIIVLGDFNLTVGDPAWRDLHAGSALRRPVGREPATWPSPAVGLGITIDHILARGLALGTPLPIWLPGSDHRGLITRVALP